MRTAARVAFVVAAGITIASACGDGDDRSGGGSEAEADEAPLDAYPVQVDHLPAPYSATFNRFFPERLEVHPGDAIEFTMSFTGEPHNVAVGRIVDEAVAAFDAVPEGSNTLTGFPLPGITPDQQEAANRLPQPIPPDQAESMTESNSTIQPCTLVDGLPPTDGPCAEPDRRVPDVAFDGTQSYLASQGFIATDDRFRLELAEDISPGDYQFICTVHAAWMDGTFTVRPRGQTIPSPEEVQALADAEIAEAVEEFRPRAEEILADTGPEVASGALGSPAPPPRVSLNVFPRRVEIEAGEAVTWSVEGAHTISFDLPDALDPAAPLTRSPHGALVSDQRVVDPTAGQPRQPPPPPLPRDQPPPAPPPAGVIPVAELDGGSYDGQGFLNSGLLFWFYGQPVEYRLRFSEPGEYTYYCARHPGKAGEVVVT